jgi:hypothetical protein
LPPPRPCGLSPIAPNFDGVKHSFLVLSRKSEM